MCWHIHAYNPRIQDCGFEVSLVYESLSHKFKPINQPDKQTTHT